MKRVFLRHKLLLVPLIAVLLGLILLPAVSYFKIPFERPTTFEAAVLGALLSIFLVFFIVVQLTYSVHDIPRRIVQEHSLYTRETACFILWSAFSITVSVYVVILPQGRFSYPLLTAMFVVSVVALVAFFFWFVRTVSVDGLLQRISTQTRQWFKQVDEKELELKRKHDEFLREATQLNKNFKFYIDPSLTCAIRYVGYPHYTLETDKEGVIERVDLDRINTRLSDILQSERVEVIIEVKPGCPIPDKNVKSGIYNPNLLTLALKSINIWDKVEFLKSMKKVSDLPQEVSNQIRLFESSLESKKLNLETITGHESNLDDLKPGIDKAITGILEFYARQVDSYFAIDEKYARTDPNRLALLVYRQMAAYAIVKQGEVDRFLDFLDRILAQQLYGMNQDLFLLLKARESGEMSECVMDIISACLKTGDINALRRVFTQFHKLVYRRFTKTKNSAVLIDLFEILRHTNDCYMRYAREYYSPQIQSLILHMTEFIGGDFLKQFKESEDENQIKEYFRPVLQNAIDNCYWIIYGTLRAFTYRNHPYGLEYLQDQLQHSLKLLGSYPKTPWDCLPSGQMPEQMLQERNYEASAEYRLMILKCDTVKALESHLVKSLLKLAVFTVYQFERQLLDPKILRLYILPAARVMRDHFEGFVRETIHDFLWHRDLQSFLRRMEVYPPGGYAETFDSGDYPRGLYNVKRFWILFSIYLKIAKGEFFTPSVFSSVAEGREFNGALEDLEASSSFWASGLNVREEQFKELLAQLKSEVSGIPIKQQEE